MDSCNLLLKVLLAHDGSMTYALESLTSAPLTATIIQERELESCEYFNFPVIYRETLLESNGKKLVHAVSYTSKAFYTRMGFGPGVPMGAVMKKNKVEQYRDIYLASTSDIDTSILNLLQIPQQQIYKKCYYIYIGNSPQVHMTENFLPELISLTENIGINN
jgi:chorismate-pyruvate lyase